MKEEEMEKLLKEALEQSDRLDEMLRIAQLYQKEMIESERRWKARQVSEREKRRPPKRNNFETCMKCHEKISLNQRAVSKRTETGFKWLHINCYRNIQEYNPNIKPKLSKSKRNGRVWYEDSKPHVRRCYQTRAP